MLNLMQEIEYFFHISHVIRKSNIRIADVSHDDYSNFYSPPTYSVVVPSKAGSSASASARVARTVPSL